jgi:hypothetical protein
MALQTAPAEIRPRTDYFDPQVETLSRAALAELQLERLRRTLAHTYEQVAPTGGDATRPASGPIICAPWPTSAIFRSP